MALIYYRLTRSVDVRFLQTQVFFAERETIRNFQVWQRGFAVSELGQVDSCSWQGQGCQLFRTERLPYNFGPAQDSDFAMAVGTLGLLLAQSQCESVHLNLAELLPLEDPLQFA